MILGTRNFTSFYKRICNSEQFPNCCKAGMWFFQKLCCLVFLVRVLFSYFWAQCFMGCLLMRRPYFHHQAFYDFPRRLLPWCLTVWAEIARAKISPGARECNENIFKIALYLSWTTSLISQRSVRCVIYFLDDWSYSFQENKLQNYCLTLAVLKELCNYWVLEIL